MDQQLVDILGGSISKKRAKELLEATNGSVERAVELYFHRSSELGSTDHEPANHDSSPSIKKSAVQKSPSSRSKKVYSSAHRQKRKSTQATLDSLFSKSPKNASAQSPPHHKTQSTNTTTLTKETPLSNKPESEDPLTSQNDCLDSENDIVVLDDDPPSPTKINNEMANELKDSFNFSRGASIDNSKNHPLDVPYAALVQQLTIIAGTTKRTLKLHALQNLFGDLLAQLTQHWQEETRKTQSTTSSSIERPHAQARVLHMVLDLILGKISLLTTTMNSSSPDFSSNKQTKNRQQEQQDDNQESNYVTNISLQVSGAAITKALQTVLGVSFRSPKMRQLYRKMGDLGDVSAKALEDYSSSTSSFQSFFTSTTTKTSQRASPRLTVAQVHAILQAIATVETGKGSQSRRHDLLAKLFRAAAQDKRPEDGSVDPNALRFLVRAVLGNMRLGATLKTVLTGLAMAVSAHRSKEIPEARDDAKTNKKIDDSQAKPMSVGDRLQKVYAVCPRFHEMCLALLEGGIERAEEICSIRCGYPIEPMLANPAASMDDVEDFMKKGGGSAAVAEWKYDGVRCQAHYDSNFETNPSSPLATKGVRLFSRHMLDQTVQYPDAAACFLESARLAAELKTDTKTERIKSEETIQSFVCDAEIVAVEEVTSTDNNNSCSFRLLPFQDLRRGTGGGNNRLGKVRVYCFDLLYLNGESLLKLPLWKRLSMLRDHFVETPGFTFARSIDIPALSESSPNLDRTLITKALQEAVEGGAEGLMVKLTGEHNEAKKLSKADVGAKGYYEAGTRSYEWLKVKRDYIGGYADTIDVVPIGAWYGDGRKAQAGFLSPVLLAVYDEDDDVFCSISRCLSFSDTMYKGMKDFYFHNIPYSEDGCIVEDRPSLATEDCSDKDEDEANGSADDEEDVSNDHIATNVERINCFPDRPPSSVIFTNESPPIWFKPLEVFEVSFADLSLSRVHTAAAGAIDEDRGIALRFPRFKRKRPDKKPTQATTCAQIAQLYRQQSKVSH